MCSCGRRSTFPYGNVAYNRSEHIRLIENVGNSLYSLFGVLRKNCNMVNNTICLAAVQHVFCVVVEEEPRVIDPDMNMQQLMWLRNFGVVSFFCCCVFKVRANSSALDLELT